MFKKGDSGGPGRPKMVEGRTADLKAAQRKLQQLLDMELLLPANVEAVLEPGMIFTKAQKLVRQLVTEALSGKVQAIGIVLERWAGKPALVEIEKAYVEPVHVTVSHVGGSAPPEATDDRPGNFFPAKTN